MTTASKITLLRIAFIPIFMVLMYVSAMEGLFWVRWISLAVFIIASLTDYIDGHIARKYNQVSDFGKFLDPLADKLLTIAAMVMFCEWGMLPGTDGSGEAIIAPQAIADYIFAHGELPDNFITKKEAQNLGWDSSYNYVGDVAPGKSIGGDRFGNYEGLLPSKKGRTWYEADCYYEGKKRNAHRILYSNDGLVYYTDDHYESFTQMFPSDK